MKKNKESNNLYVENPTVGYQGAQEQPTYNRKVEPYNKKKEPSYEGEKSYKNDEDFYGEKDDAYNDKEVDAKDEEDYYDEEDIYDGKAAEKVKQARSYGSPLFVAGILYVFWPLGLYWMWRYKVYKKPVRIILSIVMPIYGILRWR